MPQLSTESTMRSQLAHGFTLIEVMIVVAIIAILAAIAIPSYQDYIRRGQLQESFALMSGYQLRMEQTYQDNRSYAAVGSNRCGTDIPSSSRFAFSCALTASGQGYTLTGRGSSGAVQGYAYTINQRGERRTTLFKGKESEATCWLEKSPSC